MSEQEETYKYKQRKWIPPPQVIISPGNSPHLDDVTKMCLPFSITRNNLDGITVEQIMDRINAPHTFTQR